jgi:hypothetical protein
MKGDSLARLWLYLFFQMLLGVVGLAYVALALVSIALLVLVIGLPLALGVIALGRRLAGTGIALVRWLWRMGPEPKLAPLGRGESLAARAGAALVARSTRRVMLWHLVNALCLPVTLLACLVFPLALVWGPAHPRITWRILSPALGPNPNPAGPAPSLSQATPAPGWAPSQVPFVPLPATPSADPTPAAGGHGLVGMQERVSALGGDLTVGPTQQGGFEVQAVLPLTPA